MKLLIALVGSAVFVALFKRLIRRYPIVFYLAACVIDVALLSGALLSLPAGLAAATFPYAARCLVGFSLFAIVMYAGALPDGSKIRQAVMPIRGELSIIAAILTIGHVVNYLGSYLTQILSGFAGMSAGMVVSFCVSSVLIVLLAALTITSFEAVKSRMEAAVWKRLQKTAYAFFLLTYAHLLFVLLPTVASAGQRSMLSIILYSIVVLGWVVLRSVKAFKAKSARDTASPVVVMEDFSEEFGEDLQTA